MNYSTRGEQGPFAESRRDRLRRQMDLPLARREHVMYTVVANHNEFHPLESEQYLTITVGCAPEFATSTSFLSACKESTKRDVAGIEPTLFGALRRQTVTDNLSRFVPLVRIPHTAHVYMLNDTGDDLEVLIHWPGTFVWFHWCTSA